MSNETETNFKWWWHFELRVQLEKTRKWREKPKKPNAIYDPDYVYLFCWFFFEFFFDFRFWFVFCWPWITGTCRLIYIGAAFCHVFFIRTVYKCKGTIPEPPVPTFNQLCVFVQKYDFVYLDLNYREYVAIGCILELIISFRNYTYDAWLYRNLTDNYCGLRKYYIQIKVRSRFDRSQNYQQNCGVGQTKWILNFRVAASI